MTLFDAFRYDGKRVLVVGAASGMGAATAALVQDAGAEVVAMDFADITLPGAKAIHVNLADAASIDTAIEECGGPVHALFACAGVADGTPGIERINFIGPQPRLEHEGEPLFGEFLRRVNEILVAHPALRRGQNCEFVDGDHDAVIAVFRRNGKHGRTGYLIACNFDIFHEQTLTVDLTEFLGAEGPVDAVDLFTGKTEGFEGSTVTLKLTPCSAQVLMF